MGKALLFSRGTIEMPNNIRLSAIRNVIAIFLLLTLCATAIGAGEYKPVFEDPADFPLMGDWEGKWIDPHAGHEKTHPELAAQLVCLTPKQYLVRILPTLNVRSVPYLEIKADVKDNEIVIDQAAWKCTFANGICKGTGRLHGKNVGIELKKVQRLSPTLGQKPPKGAAVLFDGTSFDAWQHNDGRKVTWSLLKSGTMQTVSLFWDNKQNQKKGLGGDIVTKEKFDSLKFHMEFRYAVEPGKRGQGRGNSGLFFHGIGEVQILNCYGTPGYWNECGAFYKHEPPKRNAAAPPLQWQTYDVEIQLPDKNDKKTKALVTVYLNGHRIHYKFPMSYTGNDGVSIGLQDHINALQYRNIWVVSHPSK